MKNPVRFFNPGATYKAHKGEYDKAIKKVLSEGQLILRKDMEDFETWLASYVGTKYAVALNSCTDALYLALRYLKIGVGDEVLVPSRTFVATAQVIVQCGATPVYYDLDGKFEITEKTKAIMPVHIEGEIASPFMAELVNICTSKGIPVIEDAAQALGASQGGIKAGAFGLAGCFSFYPAKILGAFGDAGALTTNDEKLYNWVKGARAHFKETHEDWGINSRMDNLQAAILNVRRQYLEKNLLLRKGCAVMYNFGLANIEGLILPPQTEGRVFQDYIVRLNSREERDALFDFLKEKGVETMKNNYPFPVPKLPLAQKYEDETLRLPCNDNLSMGELNIVIKRIKDFYAIQKRTQRVLDGKEASREDGRGEEKN